MSINHYWTGNRAWMGGRRLKLIRMPERADHGSKPLFECNICRRPIRYPFNSPRHVSDVFEAERVIGGGFRPKQQCPFCLANDRLRFTIEVLRAYTTVIQKPCDVLEIAPIEGMRLWLSQNAQCRYVSGDIVPGRAQRVLDVTDIDFPDESFDFIVCCHVLEHIEREERAVSEMRRVLKPGGCLLLSFPVAQTRRETFEDASVTDAKDRLRLFGQEDHVRLYGMDAERRLAAYGLDVREIRADRDLPSLVAKYALIREDVNYLCWKREHG